MHLAPRRLLLLQGSANWCRAAAREMILPLAAANPLWIGEGAPEAIRRLPPQQIRRILGGECAVLVFDAHEGFDPDAFGAAAGTLRGGGAMLLLLPPERDWDTPFTARLLRLSLSDPAVVRIGEGEPLPAIDAPPPAAEVEQPTAGQIEAVEAIAHVVHGHRRRPLVITADRGRGKTSALGMAAARLLAEGVERVVVTAPRPDAVAPLFDHAARALDGCATGRGRIDWQGRRIEFLPPDELVARPLAGRLLLVDEAAAIPAPMLRRLLERHARAVFSTTVHGYEGSGRGFAIRFRATLDRLTPGWRELRLSQPVRWAAGDPLERFTFRALCLDATPSETPPADSAEPIAIEPLERRRLAGDEATLRPLFGLLVSAHYRTTPGDLKGLLDDPSGSLWVARAGQRIAAVALVVDEGGFDEATARAIFEGRRRPRGHLLAQSLSLHGGLEQAPRLRFARVRRIAVHPAFRRRGIGRALVEAAAADAAQRGLDALGASFGAEPELLRFWTALGPRPVHLGFTRDHAGGAHSAMVLQPLGEAGEALAEAAHRRFSDTLPLLLGGPLRDLDPRLAAQLLSHCRPPRPPTAGERREVAAVAHANRGIDASLAALRATLLFALADGGDEQPGSDLAIARLLQRRSWEECAERFEVSGRKQATAALREAFRQLLARNQEAPPNDSSSPG